MPVQSGLAWLKDMKNLSLARKAKCIKKNQEAARKRFDFFRLPYVIKTASPIQGEKA